MEQWQRIRHLAALGWSVRRIARELDLHRLTVARALDAEGTPCYQRAPVPSPLQPWIATVEAGFTEWGQVFAGDPVLASAALDRLLHRCTVVNIRGDSYRLKERRKAGASSTAADLEEGP